MTLSLAGVASGQEQGQGDAFGIHGLGEAGIEFHDTGARPGQSYRVEWSADLNAWWRSWEPLDDVRSRGADLATAVALPRYFRVVKVESAFSSVAALKEEDFLTDAQTEAAKVNLGRHLFYDKVLSGNRNISCATCHHSLTGTGDGLSLPVGEGGRGLGVTRDLGEGDTFIHERVPRNAPAVFNLGMAQFTTMFHDGRVSTDADQPSGFASPAGDQLPSGLDSALAAQAMFPVTSATEMAGQQGENEVADAAAAGNLPQVWEILAERLRTIPAYFVAFRAAFPDQVNQASDITFVHAANA
ncbi:MAG: cytochrome-c peroxidase, partial [Verrucomicrobiales bacterium]